jgi:16S rRNA (guanine966-N2)-methyltransferase
MRVVAGTAKGRRLQGPTDSAVRPTSDRVREAMFDVLASMDVVDGASVADLFAGTGALGIEALSRGASTAVLVDQDKAALDALKVNLVTTGLYARATVVDADVLTWLATAAPVDLAFVDPPYAFTGWTELLAQLDAGLVVVESDREIDVGGGWKVLKTKHYGGTVVTMAEITRSRP